MLHTPKACVLVVDDEPSWCALLQQFLKRNGYATLAVNHGVEAIRLANVNCFDVVLLDRDMPQMDGIEICRRIRRLSLIPIVFISASAETKHVIAALQNGADDFVAKDRYSVELVPRIQALLRRQRPNNERHVYQKGELFVYVEQRITIVRNQQIVLTPAEFDLLLCLIQHVGKPVSKERLTAAVWDTPFISTDQIRSLVRRLREKIEVVPSQPKYVSTVRGIGYQLLDSP